MRPSPVGCAQLFSSLSTITYWDLPILGITSVLRDVPGDHSCLLRDGLLVLACLQLNEASPLLRYPLLRSPSRLITC